MGSLFLLFLLFSSLSLHEVHCMTNFPISPLFLSSSAMQHRTSIDILKDTENKTSFDPQSTVNLTDERQNTMKSVPKLEWTNKFKLRFEKNSSNSSRGLNYSGSLSVLNMDKDNGLNGSNPALFDDIEKLMTSLLERNNVNSLNATIIQLPNSLGTVALKIDTNNLSTLPVNVFHDLINLENITMSENIFTSIPKDLFIYNRRLRIVELVNNKMNLTKLPPKLFSGFYDLKVVWLQSTGLQLLTEDLFFNSYRLEEIDLSKNYFDNLPKNLLRDAYELKKLNLSFNYLTTLPNDIFSTTRQLYLLDLSNNRIRYLNRDLFVGLSSLEILEMKNNELKFIHADALISLSSLKVAKFSHNHLHLTTDFRNNSEEVSPFRHCQYLRVLDLSHNNISVMFNDWIVNSGLRSLNLSYNNFSHLETKDLLFKSTQLRVDLRRNLIKDVNMPMVRKYPSPPHLDINRYVSLDLNDNPIDCYCEAYPLAYFISRSIHGILEPDYLRYVKIENAACNSPENLKGRLLKDLYNDKLSCTIENGRSGACAAGGACDCHILPSWCRLDLNCDRRNLTVAPAWINHWNLNNIYMNFSGNALTKLPNMKKGGYESIRWSHIDFSRNQIDHLDKDFLTPDMQVVNLNHNKLTTADWDEIWKTYTVIRGLKMLENPWTCTEEILAFQEKVREYSGPFGSSWDMNHFTCNKSITTTTATSDLSH